MSRHHQLDKVIGKGFRALAVKAGESDGLEIASHKRLRERVFFSALVEAKEKGRLMRQPKIA